MMTSKNKQQTVFTTIDVKTYGMIQQACINCNIDISLLIQFLIIEGVEIINRNVKTSYVQNIKQTHKSTFIQMKSEPNIEISTTINYDLYSQVRNACKNCNGITEAELLQILIKERIDMGKPTDNSVDSGYLLLNIDAADNCSNDIPYNELLN